MFDIGVERYLTIFNDNLAIFNDRNVHTGVRKLSPKRYRQISLFIAQWETSFNRFQKQLFIDIFSEAAALSLKIIEMFLGAAAHLLKHKKYVQKQLHTSSWFLHKIYTLWVEEPFNDYKNVFNGWFKPKALHIPWLMLLFHLPTQASYHRICSGLSYVY